MEKSSASFPSVARLQTTHSKPSAVSPSPLRPHLDKVHNPSLPTDSRDWRIGGLACSSCPASCVGACPQRVPLAVAWAGPQRCVCSAPIFASGPVAIQI
jgi:hypothetical protein